MSVCGCCGVPYTAGMKSYEHHKECIWFYPRVPAATQDAYNLGKYDYYAKTAKGDNYVFNPYPAIDFPISRLRWQIGYDDAQGEQTRFYLAADPATIASFFGIEKENQ